MTNSLLIVESPSKAKTLKKYLGKDFEILASYGHIRDLVPKTGAVDPEHNFAMKYELIEKNAKHFDAIAKAVKDADVIYLATDPDREGEAIAWHLEQLLEAKRLLKGKQVHRVVFHEITQTAVQAAVQHPRQILMPLVNAQQARRALDYLVGFNLSPLLWRKIRRGLSAGRVQSPALRLIVEREQEIEKFVSQEYWSMHLHTHKGKQKFSAKLIELQGERIEQFSITSDARQQEVLSALASLPARVSKIDKRKKSRSPMAPFTTSTLQQEAVRKLGFTTQRTMRAAQQLYEGVAVNGAAVGLITYMRTDSVNLANEALDEIRDYISQHYDAAYLPAKPVTYKSKAKNAQEAHEAIRPTSIHRDPDSVKAYLTAEQFKLYEMIWKRTLACQMSAAQFDTVAADITLGDSVGVFRASGQVQTFAGFLAVYQEGREEEAAESDEDQESKLPPLTEGDLLPVDELNGEQHFTQPPPRYSEASLVKALEEYGIGRPSTYASIISTLIAREYVVLEKKRFSPTDVGRVVNRFLTEHFTQYVDYDFTARLEDRLDDVSNGEQEWLPLLDEFWQGFHHTLDEKKNVDRKDITQELLDEACPKCQKPLSLRLGKRDNFIGCTGYPECDYTRSTDAAPGSIEEPTVVEGRSCPECNSALHIKSGPYGKFIGCAGYPKCKFIEPLEKPKDTGVTCPECNKGSLIERKSRYGKLFYSCNSYPKCKYATWNPPISETCPKCQWPVLTLKTTKRRGTEKVCPQKECGHAEQIAAPE